MGDGGTQAAGSVGSGACTHEGNGFWTYAPAQAETNYDHVAFTFVNLSAVNATVQIYPSFPQTGDNYPRLGAPAGASHAADVAAVLAKTPDSAHFTNARGDKLDDLDATVSSRLASGSYTAPDNADIALIKAKTDNLPSDPADGSLIIAATDAIMGRLGTPAGSSVSVDLAAVKTDTAAIKAKTDNLPASPAAVSDIPTAADNAGAVWDEDMSGHTTAGTAGKELSDAGAAGSPPSASDIADEVQTRTIAAVTVVNGLAANTVDASALASDAVTEIQSGLATASAVAAVAAKTSNLPASPAATSDIPSAATIAAAVWAYVVEGTTTAVQLMRGFASALLGIASGLATTTAVFRDIGDTKDRITATVDVDGNRSAVTTDLT
ncbi:MAG: hypothetical protein ACRENK_15645 [Gemmatimonadaceae bacterium]